MHAAPAKKSLQAIWFLLALLMLVRCTAEPAHAEESCTAKYTAMYEKDVAEVKQGKGGPLGQKIAINALARYYEDQWLICKQLENSDEQFEQARENPAR